MDSEMRKFGFNLALGLNILGWVMFHSNKDYFIWFISAGVLVLIITCARLSKFLKPLKKMLDIIVKGIALFTLMLNLFLVFFLIFTVIGLILRFFKKDLLNQRIYTSSHTYWIKRNPQRSVKESYERMG